MEAPSFPQLVYAIVRRVPRGRVITYGAIAQLLGEPRKARQVGWAMAVTPARVPWHRVINARGEISLRHVPDVEAVQRKKLEAEGVVFDADGRVDLERYLWLPSVALRRSHPAAGKQSRNRDHDDRAYDGDHQAR